MPFDSRPDIDPPPATRLETRIGIAITAAAMIWMALVAGWGIAGPAPDGHFAITANVGTCSDNMWRMHSSYPVCANLDRVPATGDYYLHHPLGLFWLTALFLKVFGGANWVLRLIPTIFSTLTPLFVYWTGRAIWGPVQGALGALAFASLPITMAFAGMNGLEVGVIFWVLLGIWGYVRFRQTWRERFALLSVLGVLGAVNYDWCGYLWAIGLLVVQFGWGYFVPEKITGPLRLRPFSRYVGFLAVGLAASVALMLHFLAESGRMSNLFVAYASRIGGKMTPLTQVLQTRHWWLETTFTPLAIILGKLAVLVMVFRFVVRRVELELLNIPVLVMCIIQYTHFHNGADIHIFWPQAFGLYFALAVPPMVSSLRDGLQLLGRKLRQPWGAHLQRWALLSSAGVFGLSTLLIFKDGASVLRYAHETGGRFNSSDIQSDVDKVVAMRWWLPRFAPTEAIAFHAGTKCPQWAMQWEVRPRVMMKAQPLMNTDKPRPYFMDSRLASSADLRFAASILHPLIVGSYWMIDRSQPAGPIDGFSFQEREPGPLEWYFKGGTEPVRTVVADPWLTWEWRDLLKQPATPPTGAPSTTDQLRVAHNVAVATGRTADVERFRRELETKLTSQMNVALDRGLTLLGVRHERGAQRRFTVFFLAGEPRGAAKLAIKAQVVKKPRWSMLPRDTRDLNIAWPFPIPMDMWKPGHIYSVQVPYYKRPGRERFVGTFVSLDRSPVPRLPKGNEIELLVVD